MASLLHKHERLTLQRMLLLIALAEAGKPCRTDYLAQRVSTFKRKRTSSRHGALSTLRSMNEIGLVEEGEEEDTWALTVDGAKLINDLIVLGKAAAGEVKLKSCAELAS